MSIPDLFDMAKDGKARERVMALIIGQSEDHFAGKPLGLISNTGSFHQISIHNQSWTVSSDFKLICPKEWHRLINALAFLEHVGTPQAAEIIQAMTTGHKEAWPTIRAKEALARLQKN